MNRLLRNPLLLTATLLASSCASSDVREVQNLHDAIAQVDREQALLSRFDGVLNGTWAGSFEIYSPSPNPVTDTIELCVTIDTTSASAFVKGGEEWRELKPGRFEARRYGPSALLYTIGGGETPGGGPWVEAWTISLTQASRETLLVRTSRVVNNVDVPYGSPDARYSFSGEGILRYAGWSCG